MPAARVTFADKANLQKLFHTEVNALKAAINTNAGLLDTAQQTLAGKLDLSQLNTVLNGLRSYFVLTLAQMRSYESDGLPPFRLFRITDRAGDDVLVFSIGPHGLAGELAYTTPAGTDNGPYTPVAYDLATDATAARNGASYTDEQARDAIGSMLQSSATIAPTFNDAADSETLEIKPGSILISHLDPATVDALTSATAKVPLTRDTLFWQEADTPAPANSFGGFLRNKVPTGPGIYHLHSVMPGESGSPVAQEVPLRLSTNTLNGFPVVAFNNNSQAGGQADRSTYNCNAFQTLRYGPRPGTFTILCRNTATTDPALGDGGRKLAAFGGIQFGVNGAASNFRYRPQMGTAWGIVTLHFTWLGRAMVHLNGEYVGTLPDGEDFMFGYNDGGYMTLGDDFQGEFAALLISQDSSRPCGLLHENYLADKYGIII